MNPNYGHYIKKIRENIYDIFYIKNQFDIFGFQINDPYVVVELIQSNEDGVLYKLAKQIKDTVS